MVSRFTVGGHMYHNPKEPHPNKNVKPTVSDEVFRGTREMPMPETTALVAGRNRHGRTITEPGDPGIIKPEDDVLDTSKTNR